MIAALFVLVAACLLSVGHCQAADSCGAVTMGLLPALGACRQSVRSCIGIEIAPGTNLTRVSNIFCIATARPSYNNFLACEEPLGLGVGFTDQVFGGICGGPGCAGDQSFASCQPPEGERCYNDAVVRVNEGMSAFEACLCSDSNQTSAAPSCPAECRTQLQQLVADVGCCVNTVVYSLYFGTCGDSDGEGDASVSVISNLFDACDLDLPPSCLTPFSPEPESGAAATTAGLLAYMIVLTVLVIV